MSTKQYDFTVYSEGMVFCSVCTDVPKDKLPEVMGEHSPTGISSDWQVSEDDFKDGTPNGSQCPDKPANKHWLMVC